jgi:hypothetical protein
MGARGEKGLRGREQRVIKRGREQIEEKNKG